MNYDCELIRDLLPLYEDNTASTESSQAVFEHLKDCELCRQYAEEMKSHSPKLDFPLSDSETLQFTQIAKRIKFKKFMKSFFIIIFILCCFYYVNGGRLTPYQSSQANRFIDKNSILLEKEDFGSMHVFIYENEDKYHTVIANYNFPFWRAGSSFYANKTDDLVKLVGWCSYRVKNKSITVVPIQSFDEQVAYIEMGPDTNRIRKEVPVNQVVLFSWEQGIRWNDLNGIAYTQDGEALYKLGYEIINSTIHADELRWLPIEKSDATSNDKK